MRSIAPRHAVRALRARRWRSGAYVSEASPIVIGGCPRSGTTLLRVMLDSHPRVCCGPESGLFGRLPLDDGWMALLSERFDIELAAVRALWASAGSQGEFVERFFDEYCAATGKARWAEKTPRNVRELDFVFAHFPQAQFIHVIRDGRDAVCSIREFPRHPSGGADGLVPTRAPRPIEECVDLWVDSVRAGLRYRGDPRYSETRYETLVFEPEVAMRALLAWLGEPWSDQVLHHELVQTPSRDVSRFPQNPEAARPIYRSATGRWRTDLTPAEARVVHERAGDLLAELGYITDGREPLE